MPKAIKKRTEKKIHKEGDISETVVDIREKLKERQRTLVYSLLVFGVVVIAVSSFFIYNKVTTSKALELEYEGYKIFYGESQAQIAPPADRFKNALEKFKASYAARKNPAVLLYIANCYYELGNLDETLKTLKDLTTQYSDPKIISLAYYKMAMTYVRKGDMTNALNTLNSLASIKDSPLQDMALLESGKILESMGKTDDARKKYNELINKFPKSSLVNEAQTRVGK
ncbi:MAG: tetratricopeptide repeat protein [Nitrospirae bacterium]|nr:tetratricopeptide repeat protein [Nitrospirota bacterium]